MVEINKTLVTAIAGTFIILIQMCSATPGPVISVEPSYQNVSKGVIFTVNITVNPDGGEIGSAQYDLCFNNTLVTALKQTKGPFLSQDGISTNVIRNIINNTVGKVEHAEYRVGDPEVVGGVTNPGVLATITFKAMEPGTGSLNLSNVILSDPFGNQISDVLINDETVVIKINETKINETHFNISGFVNHSDGSPVNNPNVTITNLNTSEEFIAETNISSNYYQILTNFAHITKGNILHFYASNNIGNSTEFDRKITQEEIDAGGFVQNISIYIIPDTTSTSGDDGSDDGASVTPTPTQTPTSTPTQKPGLTPTLTPTINHVSPPSTPLSPTTTISPTPTAPTPSPTSKENNRLPGFEAAFAVIELLAISYFILKRRMKINE